MSLTFVADGFLEGVDLLSIDIVRAFDLSGRQLRVGGGIGIPDFLRLNTCNVWEFDRTILKGAGECLCFSCHGGLHLKAKLLHLGIGLFV